MSDVAKARSAYYTGVTSTPSSAVGLYYGTSKTLAVAHHGYYSNFVAKSVGPYYDSTQTISKAKAPFYASFTAAFILGWAPYVASISDSSREPGEL